MTLRLADTAGLRESGGTVEQIGIGRARREIREAELVLAVFDGSEPLTEEDGELLDLLSSLGPEIPKIAVVNKADRGTVLTSEELAKIAAAAEGRRIPVSAEKEEGISDLSRAVGEIYASGSVDLRRDAVIWDARQRQALEHARSALAAASEAAGRGDRSEEHTSELQSR